MNEKNPSTTDTEFSSSLLPDDFDLKPYQKVEGTIWSILLYPDDPMCNTYLQNIKDAYPDEFAYIIHSEDTWTNADEEANPDHKAGTAKKPHIHVVLYFQNGRKLSAIAKAVRMKPNLIQRQKSYKKALRYLIHADHPSKYQYPIDDVQGPLKSVLVNLLTDEKEKQAIDEIIQLIASVSSYTELIVKCNKLGLYSYLRRMGGLVIQLMAERPDPRDQQYCWDCKCYAPKEATFCAYCGKPLNQSRPNWDAVIKGAGSDDYMENSNL